MTSPIEQHRRHPDIIAIAIGNSRVRCGRFEQGQLQQPTSMKAEDVRGVGDWVAAEMAGAAAAETAQAQLPAQPPAQAQAQSQAVVLAGVHEQIRGAIAACLQERGISAIYTIGEDLPIPIQLSLDDHRTVGHDRLLCAMAAYARAQQACIVVDAGTAITVDFVDGQGTFHGGAICPGIRMMLRALHEWTAALPLVQEIPEPRESYGKDTPSAMALGVLEMARGGVHRLVQRYAEAYGAYPQIVATGGDAALLFAEDDVIEHVVPDLQLMGIYEACARVLREDDD